LSIYAGTQRRLSGKKNRVEETFTFRGKQRAPDTQKVLGIAERKKKRKGKKKEG